MYPIGIILLIVAAAACGIAIRRWAVRQRSLDRVFSEPQAKADDRDASAADGGLQRWLFLAGYRRPNAVSVFVSSTLVAIAIGLAVAFVIWNAGLVLQLVSVVNRLPPGIGDLLVPVAYLMPWTTLLILIMVPWLVVRQARRQRVQQVEIDLPISLELLATLSEAGLGFDAALSRVLDSVGEDRPLAREFRTYQSDLLAGRTRVDALRRMANRLEVPAVSVLISALVQAEQMGSGIALALRRQADDLRDRRRERATAFAMALPIKRMFPLVICFMPGIFVWTLGPFFVQLIQFADTFIRVQNF